METIKKEELENRRGAAESSDEEPRMRDKKKQSRRASRSRTPPRPSSRETVQSRERRKKETVVEEKEDVGDDVKVEADPSFAARKMKMKKLGRQQKFYDTFFKEDLENSINSLNFFDQSNDEGGSIGRRGATAPPPPMRSRSQGGGGGLLREPRYSTKTDFFADSPYYDAFTEKEVYSAELLCDILNEISEKASIFSKAGGLLCTASRHLSLSFGLYFKQESNSEEDIQLRRDALGSENAEIFEQIGVTLGKIAHIQEGMFKTIESLIGSQLAEIAEEQMKIVKELKQTADDETKVAEQTLHKYVIESGVSEPEKNIVQLGNFGRLKSPGDDSPQTKFANWKHSLHDIRITQTSAELQRLKFIKNLVDSRRHVANEISHNVGIFFREIRGSFRECSDKLNDITPIVNENLKKCNKSLESHKKNGIPSWERREKLLNKTLDKAREEADKIDQTLVNVDENNIHELNQEKAEGQVQIWHLPNDLAICSRFRRDSPAGVLVEGWLYEQRFEQRRLSMATARVVWDRKWFLLKDEALFCLQKNAGNIQDSEAHNSTVKTKICDIVLSTVRDVPANSSGPLPVPRFCFEVIVSSQQSFIFTARGPKEYDMWVNGIRNAVAKQLAKGQRKWGELNSDIGLKIKSSEIRTTILERNLSLFHIMDNHDSGGNLNHGRGDDHSSYADSHLSNNSSYQSIAESNYESDSNCDDDFHNTDEPMEKVYLKKITDANPTCADCGKESPDWASLNLGVLVCLECSGVHRSLGVHVSKVRSLALDSLSDAESSLLYALGNDRMNKIWERKITKNLRKPDPESADRKTREEWIRHKYVDKEFLGINALIEKTTSSEKEEKLSKLLNKAARKADVIGIARFLAHGANIDWKNEAVPHYTKTALEICNDLLNKGVDKAVECTELLVQNGAKIGRTEDDQSYDSSSTSTSSDE